jgi:hypothetical protein
MAGWIAIAVVQEITAETFRGFHDIRLATLLGGLATGGKSGGLIMRVVLLGILGLLWVRSEQTSLATVMLVCIGSGSVSMVLALWLLYGKISSLGPSESAQEEEPVSAKEVLEDAIPFLAIALTSFVLLSAGIWILGFFHEEVAVYGAASRLVTFVAMPLLIVNLVLPPNVAEMYAQARTGRLERTLRTFSTLAGVPFPCWSLWCSWSWEGRYWGWSTGLSCFRPDRLPFIRVRSCWYSLAPRNSRLSGPDLVGWCCSSRVTRARCYGSAYSPVRSFSS